MSAVILRAPEASDIPALVDLTNCPGVRHGTARMPVTGAAWVETRVPNTSPLIDSLVAEVEGLARGWASLVRKTGRQAHCGSVGLSVHDDYVGQGLGRAMLTALLDIADNWLGLRRVDLQVNVDNAAAIALYRNADFEVEGTLRANMIRDGHLVDSHIMARHRPAPERKDRP